MFDILIEKKPNILFGELSYSASIIIDEFKEEFIIPVSYWSISDYKKSWYVSLREGLKNRNHAALMVSMYEPRSTNFIFTWTIYFLGNKAVLQNKIIFLD